MAKARKLLPPPDALVGHHERAFRAALLELDRLAREGAPDEEVRHAENVAAKHRALADLARALLDAV